MANNLSEIAICEVDSPLKQVPQQSNLKSGTYVTKKRKKLSGLMLHKLVFLFIFLLLSSSLLGFQRCLHPPQYSGKHSISSYILLYLCIYHVSLLIILKKNVLSVTKNIPLEDYLATISCQTL